MIQPREEVLFFYIHVDIHQFQYISRREQNMNKAVQQLERKMQIDNKADGVMIYQACI